MTSTPNNNTHKSLNQLGENAVLRQLLPHCPTNPDLILGPGDDCAVIKGDELWDGLLKTDVVVEGIHFLRDTPPALIGRKALARAISDIAAMGGIPQHALITLLVHPSRSVKMLEELYHDGLCPLAQEYHISLAGGETSALPHDGFIINVALTGKVERGRAVLRSGAQVGDALCVSGQLGGSFPSGRHLSFTPRLELSRALMQAQLAPQAMMDLSDGLAVDLERLCAASGCSYELELEALPCHAGCSYQQALQDGEDYELLLCFHENQWERIQHMSLPCPITRIGTITQDAQHCPMAGGWNHFTNTR